MKSKKDSISNATNDAAHDIAFGEPYIAAITIIGTADMLFHRYSVDAVIEKGKAKKGSAAKKSDNIESYVYRDETGMLCLPGEYLRQAIIHAAKFQQDPRSPRKSAMDLFKAGVVALTDLAPLGVKDWDYVDRRRVLVQRNAVPRERPAMRKGWSATIELQVLTPEYIDEHLLHETLNQAGRLIGVGDFRPTFGRFRVEKFERLSLTEATAAE